MKNLARFLSESNKIECVYDKRSLELATEAWEYIYGQDTLTIENILETHRILMQEHLGGEDLGKFRTRPVFIGVGRGAQQFMIPSLIRDWLEQANEDKTWFQIKKSHVQYEKIHPFIDGNGRSGRILMNWRRAKVGLPILVIKEKEKFSYYKWFS